MAKIVPFNPQSDAPVIIQMDEKSMAALFVMIEDIVRKVVKEEMNLATEKPMNTDQVKDFLGYQSVGTVRLKTRQGLIPSHALETGSASPHRLYFASEINAKLKGKK